MRVYFDENFSPSLIKGFQCFQEGRPADGVTVLSVRQEFGIGSPDEEWIPQVASNQGVIITQDQNIHRIRSQAELCRRLSIGIFIFKPPRRGWSYWAIAQRVLRWWVPMIEFSRAERRPFAVVIDDRTKQLTRL